jgi:hypothetical protein
VLRLLPWLVAVVLLVWGLVDCISTPEEDLRGLPKVLWVLLILLVAPLGSIVYFFAGRPKRPTAPSRPRGRTLAPDDDPEFLEELRQRRRQQERDGHVRGDEDGGTSPA